MLASSRQPPATTDPPGKPPAKSLPCKGRCPQRGRRGALPLCPAGILQTPAVPCPTSVGDDACIVPQTQRCRKARKGIGRTRRSTPQSAGADSSPCRGAFWVKAARQKPPLQGEVPATRAEGCIAALPRRYPSKPGSALLRVRRGRCLHRPASLLQLPTHRESRPPKASPVRGGARNAGGGVHCRFAPQVSFKPRQGLAPHP